VAHHDELPGAAPAREVGGRRDVVHAARKIVRLAVTDAYGPDAARRERNAEVVVETLGRTEQAAHPTSAGDEHLRGVDGAVPQERDEPAHRVDLEVTKVRRDLDLLHRERFEQVER
jgi:hypothetical protein